MIKASIKGKNGRDLLVIGLSFANLDELRANPGDTYIKIDGKQLGLSSDVVIYSGQTETDCAASVADLIGPNTKTTVSERLKN